MFYMSSEKELTEELIVEYIELFESEKMPSLKLLDDYYNNKNKILERKFDDTSKPNNKIAHKFARYIVDTNTAIFLGAPVSYKSEEDTIALQEVLDANDEHDINVDLATNAGIYGYSIQLVYLDEEAAIRFAILSNLRTVLIYSDDIEEKLLYAIRFSRIEDDITYTVYSSTDVWGSNTPKEVNKFGGIPVIVYKNNSRMTGDFEHVIHLIDAYDLLESDTLNEQDYFNNCYLYLDTEDIDADQVGKMKENRIIYGKELNPKFLLKEGSGTELENTKNRVVSDIHKLSMTPDLSDKDFANNVSGVAMKYKLMGLLNNVANKERKFRKGLHQRNILIYSILSIKMVDDIKKVEPVFTRNIPQNNIELVEVISKLKSLVSNETLLNLLPFIEDASVELERVSEEKKVSSKYSNLLEDQDDE